VKRERSGW